MPSIYCMNDIPRKGTDHLPDSFSLTENLSEADGILVRSASFDDFTIPDNVAAIARSGADVSKIPVCECSERGVVVFNTPGANANAVKEAVLCALIMSSRNIVPGISWIRDNIANATAANACNGASGQPTRSSDEANLPKQDAAHAIYQEIDSAKDQFSGCEIAGKKLGIIGLGAIGTLVANAAVGLGMKVFGFDPFESVNDNWRLSSHVEIVSYLDDICANCDYITVHVPASPENENLIDARKIALMKPTATLINYSSVSVVDGNAVAAALNNRKLNHYVTDFATPAVVNAERSLVTPHIGAATAEAKENCAVMAVEEIVDYIENGNIRNSINYPACYMGNAPETGSRIAVLHRNVPGIINSITSSIGASGINLSNITSRARGDYAYALIDVDSPLGEDSIEAARKNPNILRVRVVK